MAKILVIDDDIAIVDLLRMHLVAAGHKIHAAMDATGGMMLATRERPDLITLDFQMPAGDGGKVFERLRVNTVTGKIPIVFISGMNKLDLEFALKNDPTVRFLQKPIDIEALKRCIAELLSAPPAAS